MMINIYRQCKTQEAFAKVNNEAVGNEKKIFESINFDACCSKKF